ncbi:cation-binding protein [Anaerocolumna cellulosilytica]|uniref:Cation-binding protein n=1 Tax=Anaerocolumna cellulosilytica TaxID=433286 RepID=A0A6S6QV78_9FIRM|nr:hemerythrin domain-containing protein [Anaerocolumna cellulosilytica]MBB5197967.1 iron-sulfur cluster repair protein YtfE (RIC family) [Anaerocolumna cellulosilytica]BCJ95153.1 cation-binding protein [Anaerocolumna cellulosilytica]
MINLENMNRQHNTIREEINFILKEAEKGANMDIQEIALHINKLAGQLKIHLLEEDRFLYPALFNGTDDEIKKISHLYMQEMGSIDEDYKAFKIKYNIGSKISKDISTFLQEAKEMMKTLTARMDKEDRELYRLIQERKL